MTKVDQHDRLEDLYQGDVPEYVLEAGKSFIKVRVSDWRGEQDLSIRPKDVVDYYRNWAGNIVSGCRVIAGWAGDWRPIDRLARECLRWFRFVNSEVLNRKETICL